MINAIGIALNGLAAATDKFAKSAERIVNPGNAETLPEDIVNIGIAKTEFKANLAVMRTADEMSDELLRIFDKKV